MDVPELERCVICAGHVHETLLTCDKPECRDSLNDKPEAEIAALRKARVIKALQSMRPGKAFWHLTGKDGTDYCGWT